MHQPGPMRCPTACLHARKAFAQGNRSPDLQHEGELLQHRICGVRPQVAPPRPQHRHQLQQPRLTCGRSTTGGRQNCALHFYLTLGLSRHAL